MTLNEGSLSGTTIANENQLQICYKIDENTVTVVFEIIYLKGRNVIGHIIILKGRERMRLSKENRKENTPAKLLKARVD